MTSHLNLNLPKEGNNGMFYLTYGIYRNNFTFETNLNQTNELYNVIRVGRIVLQRLMYYKYLETGNNDS